VSQPQQDERGLGSRQFSLRGLLLFVTLSALWLSQLAYPPFDLRDQTEWLRGLFAAVVWVVFAAYYVAYRRSGALLLHALGPAAFVAISLPHFWPPWGVLNDIAWLLAQYCCLFSIISFPVSGMEFLGELRRRK